MELNNFIAEDQLIEIIPKFNYNKKLNLLCGEFGERTILNNKFRTISKLIKLFTFFLIPTHRRTVYTADASSGTHLVSIELKTTEEV